MLSFFIDPAVGFGRLEAVGPEAGSEVCLFEFGRGVEFRIHWV